MTSENGSPTVAELHDRLRATAERPVDPTASRWIGEAEAVAGDLVGEDVDPEADEHVVAARRIAAGLLSEQ